MPLSLIINEGKPRRAIKGRIVARNASVVKNRQGYKYAYVGFNESRFTDVSNV